MCSSVRVLAIFSVLAPTALLVLLPSLVRAQEPNSTDPTEPSTAEPVVRLPAADDASAAQPEGDDGGDAAEDRSGEAKADDEEDDEEETTKRASIPGDPFGDVGEGGLLSLRALFQVRYISTFARASTNERASYRVRENWLAQEDDGFSLNRIFLRVASDPSEYFSFKAVVDFGELVENDPEDTLKQAYVTFRPLPKHLEIVVGQFKVPFSTLELDASSRAEFTEFGQANDLTNRLNFAGRDIGIQVLVAPLRKAKRLRLTVGAFRGHAYAEHDSPGGSIGARAETKPNKRLRFGADVMHHIKTISYRRPFNDSNDDVALNPPDPNYPNARTWTKGTAYSADARYKRKGFMVRGEAMFGDRVDYDERYAARTFWAAWGLVAYGFDVGRVRLLPAVRYEWFDADREHGTGIAAQLTGALNVLFMEERVRVVLDITATDVQANMPILNQPNPVQAEPYTQLDRVRGTLQLQVQL
jgi:hypothetical protein